MKFWGVRGSIPTPGPETVHYGGNTACLEFRGDGELIILDAGSGMRPLGLSLAREFKGKPMSVTLLITHTHWDHIQGFPFFVPAYMPQNSIRILGYEGAKHGLEETLSGQMESPYFPIGMNQMPGNIVIQELRDLQFNIGKIKITAAYMNHPGICVGYRLTTSAGSIVYIPDNENFVRFKAHPGANQADTQSKAAIEYARKQEQKQIEFIQGADILVIDSQYDTQEYESHVGWGHSCVDDSVTMGIKGRVKKLFLFHHDPTHSDEKVSQMLEHARQLVKAQGADLCVDAARESLEIVL